MNKYKFATTLILFALIWSPAPTDFAEKIGQGVLLAAYGALCYAWGLEDNEQVHTDT